MAQIGLAPEARLRPVDRIHGIVSAHKSFNILLVSGGNDVDIVGMNRSAVQDGCQLSDDDELHTA
jgi:hypothetical protein